MPDNSQVNANFKDDVHSSYIDGEQWDYEEVESIISNKDDPTMACYNVRTIALGLILVAFQSFINTYLIYRTQIFQFSSTHMLFFVYPIGVVVARLTSKKTITIKEHALIFMMSTVTSGSILSLNIFDVQRIYSLPETHPVLAVLFIITCALAAIGLAGEI